MLSQNGKEVYLFNKLCYDNREIKGVLCSFGDFFRKSSDENGETCGDSRQEAGSNQNIQSRNLIFRIVALPRSGKGRSFCELIVFGYGREMAKHTLLQFMQKESAACHIVIC